jgi:hypothetical protein
MNTVFKTRFFLLLISLLLFEFLEINAQDFPIVPADMPEYLANMKAITDAGVYTRTDWRYMLQGGNITTIKYKEIALKYDDQGRIKEIMNVDQKGTNKSVIIYRYDKRNLPILESEFLPTGELEGKTKYTYDVKGFLKDITWLNSFEFIFNRYSFDFNDTTGMITEWHFYSPDSVTQKIEYYYSNPQNGFITRQKIFIGEDKLENIIIWNRDSTQHLLNKEFRNPQGKLMYYLEYKYNTKELPDKILRVLPNGTKTKKFEFEYEESGLKTGEIEYNEEGEILSYIKYSYE